MSFLLDTHAFLWFVNDHAYLSPTAKGIIEDQQKLVYLSAANIWEMAIKTSLQKLALPAPFQQFVETHINKNDFGICKLRQRTLRRWPNFLFQNQGIEIPLIACLSRKPFAMT